MRGVWTALITPFLKSGEIDFDSYCHLLHLQAQAGVTGVIPCGSTGEATTLSLEEKKQLILITLETLKNTSVRVVAGTGSNDTLESVSFSRWAAEQGVHGVMAVTPYYNKPSQAGLIKHFLMIADAIPVELVVYNVPGRTGVSMTVDTLLELAKHPRIRSLKEATGNVAFSSEILDQLTLNNRSLDILSGDDATYFPLLSIGASGVISVASNLFPEPMVRLQKHVDAGQLSEARKIHLQYYPLFRDLFVESNPVPVKEALQLMGLCSGYTRLPLVPLEAKNREKLIQSLIRCKLLSDHSDPGSLSS